MVVDSPPGMISPSSPSSCSGSRTSTASAPSRRSTAACSRKFPCTARTPILSGFSIVFDGNGAYSGAGASVAAVLLVAAKKPIVPSTAQLDRLVAYAIPTNTKATIETKAKSASLVWHQ